MSTKEAYKQKIEAEVELAQANRKEKPKMKRQFLSLLVATLLMVPMMA